MLFFADFAIESRILSIQLAVIQIDFPLEDGQSHAMISNSVDQNSAHLSAQELFENIKYYQQIINESSNISVTYIIRNRWFWRFIICNLAFKLTKLQFYETHIMYSV